MKERSFFDIANQIIKVIKEECTFDKCKINGIVECIEKVIYDNRYKAPELQWISWEELSDILRTNFIPANSKWETKLMILFNNLNGTIEDYWDDETNSLRMINNAV